MNKPNSNSRIKRWMGDVTDLDRYIAGIDPRQMHFDFYIEPRRSDYDLGDSQMPTDITAESPDLLLSAA